MPSDKDDAIDLLNQIGDAAGVQTGLPRDQAAEDQKRWQRQMTHQPPTPGASAVANIVKGTPEAIYRASPFNTEPRPIGENLSNIASSFLAPGVGKLAGPVQSIVRKVGPKLLQVAKEHPKEVMTLLGALGVGTGATTAGQTGETEDLEQHNLDSIDAAIAKAIAAKEAEIRASSQPEYDRHGKLRRMIPPDVNRMKEINASHDPGIAKLQESRGQVTGQRTKRAEERALAERPIMEKYSPESYLAQGAVMAGLPGYLGFRKGTTALGQALTKKELRNQVLGQMGWGAAESTAAPIIPELVDLSTGSGRAKEEAKAKLTDPYWLGELALGAPVGATIGGIATRAGQLPPGSGVIPRLLRSLGLRQAAREAAPQAAGPTAKMLEQIETAEPKKDLLQGMKNLGQQAPVSRFQQGDLVKNSVGRWRHKVGAGYANAADIAEYLAKFPGER